MGFDGVIFDVDGTLVDSNDAHARAFVAAFREFGHEIALPDVRRLIGKGSDKLVPELIGRDDKAIVERKKAIFQEHHLPSLRPFPQVDALLKRLKADEKKLVVASSAGKDELDALLEVAQAGPYLDAATNADDAEHSKPDPDIVQAALKRLRLPRDRCVMVGDTPYDAQAAQRAGIAFIGLRCGGWDDAALRPALGVYADAADLLMAVSVAF